MSDPPRDPILVHAEAAVTLRTNHRGQGKARAELQAIPTASEQVRAELPPLKNSAADPVASDIRPQRSGNRDTSVRVLMILQQGDQPA